MLDITLSCFVYFVIVATLIVMLATKPKGKETAMNISASKLKAGDIVITKDGPAKISKIKVTEVKIPARVEKSIVLMVNLSSGERGEYALGTSNVQMWGHEKVTKIVEPGFFKKFWSFIQSL